MTIAFNPVAVSAVIAGVSISGVTVKGISAIPQGGRLVCPIIFPNPAQLVTDVSTEAQYINGVDIDYSYNLHYIMLYAELGSGISALNPFAPMVQQIENAVEAWMASEAIKDIADVIFGGIETIGQVQDASGNSYWGALFSIHCREYSV